MKGHVSVCLVAALLSHMPDSRAEEVAAISGASNPELIPHYIALDGTLAWALATDERWNDGAATRVAPAIGISVEGARALVSYKKTLDTRAAAQVLEDRNRLCAQRANLQTAGALTEELRRMSLERKERTVDAIEGIYEVLSPEDGHKLRAYADKSKEGTSLVGSDDELSTDRNPDSFFAALCAGSQR